MAEIHEKDVLLFVTDFRMVVEQQTGKDLLKYLKKNQNLTNFKIPFKKIGAIIRNFLGSDTALGNSSGAFLDILIERHPEVEINFSIGYEIFLNFSIDIFLKKHQKKSRATINQVVFATEYGKITSTKAFIDQQSPQEVQLKDECKFRGTELCSEFVNLLFKNTTQKTYKNAMTIKRVLSEKL